MSLWGYVMSNSPTERQIRNVMRSNAMHTKDHITGEYNPTKMAEDAALEFDSSHLLDDPYHWIWDVACEVAKEMLEEDIERAQGEREGEWQKSIENE